LRDTRFFDVVLLDRDVLIWVPIHHITNPLKVAHQFPLQLFCQPHRHSVPLEPSTQTRVIDDVMCCSHLWKLAVPVTGQSLGGLNG